MNFTELALSRAGAADLKAFQAQEGLFPSGREDALTVQRLTPYLLGYRRYTVRQGDTFYRLARQYDTTVQAIARANPEQDPQRLSIGQDLIVPFGFPVVPTDLPFTSELLALCIHGLTVRYPLVYLDEGIFKVSYDLNLSRKEQLWGIQLGKKYFSLRKEPNQTWYEATEKAQQMSTDLVRISLPKKEMFDEIAKYRDAANDALMKLQAYGIETDLWEDKSLKYLTSSEYLDHYVTWWHEMIPKDKPEPCRFIGENRKHGTVVI